MILKVKILFRFCLCLHFQFYQSVIFGVFFLSQLKITILLCLSTNSQNSRSLCIVCYFLWFLMDIKMWNSGYRNHKSIYLLIYRTLKYLKNVDRRQFAQFSIRYFFCFRSNDMNVFWIKQHVGIYTWIVIKTS